jgi:hypothetical protein
MKSKGNGQDQPSGFSAEKFIEYLKGTYAAIKGEYKPAVALHLKTYLTVHQQAIRQYMTLQERKDYDRILLDFETQYGKVETYLNECIGKTVLYAMSFGISGVGLYVGLSIKRKRLSQWNAYFFSQGLE